MNLATWCGAAVLCGLLQSCALIGNGADRTARPPDGVAQSCQAERRAATACKMSDCAVPRQALDACEANAADPHHAVSGPEAAVAVAGAPIDHVPAAPGRPRKGDYMQCPVNTVSACSATRGCECAPRRPSKE
jgi:hypothetical protein